jgi:hypothetical protein
MRLSFARNSLLHHPNGAVVFPLSDRLGSEFVLTEKIGPPATRAARAKLVRLGLGVIRFLSD